MNRRKLTTTKTAATLSIYQSVVYFMSMMTVRPMTRKYFTRLPSISFHFVAYGKSLIDNDIHTYSDANSAEVENGAEEQPATPAQKKVSKKSSDRWTHDAYDESEQAPKSRAELVNSYGYDIRNEDGPPKTRRNRRYK